MIVPRHAGHLPLRCCQGASYTFSNIILNNIPKICEIYLMVDKKDEKVRILIVDNHAEVVKQVQTRLSFEEDFEVCMVAPLSQLTESILDCKPDLLLIDPYADNSYKYDRISLAMQILPSITVVVLTAVVDTALQLRLKKEKVACILEKGISSTELVDALRGVMHKNCAGQDTITQKEVAP